MATGFLDLVGTPSLISTGTNSLNVGTNGTAVVRLMAGGAVKQTVSTTGVSTRIGTVTNITTAGAETYSAAQIATGLITRDPAGAGRTDTTDTAANLISTITALAADGDTFTCYLVNTADAAEAITLAGGTGVTINNVGQTLAQNESAVLLFRRASSTTVTLYIFGA